MQNFFSNRQIEVVQSLVASSQSLGRGDQLTIILAREKGQRLDARSTTLRYTLTQA